VEQKRRAQLIEDAINATRAAIEEGIVPGGGVALLRVAPQLEDLIFGLNGSAQQGAELLQRALTRPFFHIAANAGLNAETEVTRAAKAKQGLLQCGSQCCLRRRPDPDDANADRQEAGRLRPDGGPRPGWRRRVAVI